jgi:phage tail sheath protein FI
MANLVSPGVQVSITDESVYGPAGAGTVPMIFIATGQDKVDPTGTESDGIAKYTKKENAGKPVLVTSQRELTQFFGDIDFFKESGTVQQGDETNEYGLLAAYSFLGQSSAAWIVRGDADLTGMRPVEAEPTGNPVNNTYWINPTPSSFGIFEYQLVAGGSLGSSGEWILVDPTVVVVATPTAGASTVTVVNGEYLVELVNGSTDTSVIYYVGVGGVWTLLSTATFAPHYSEPTSATVGDVWVKTTTPGNGVNFDISLFTDDTGFISKTPMYSQITDPTGATSDIFADGTAAVARVLMSGDIFLYHSGGSITIKRFDDFNSEWDDISTNSATSTGGHTAVVSTTQPTGVPVDGDMWFDDSVDSLAVYEVSLDAGVQKWLAVSGVQYATSAPATDATGAALVDGDYWIDTNAETYPTMYRHNGTSWKLKDNTDQTTSNGVVFGDLTANSATGGAFETDLLGVAPDPLIFPVGTTAVNMCRSSNTVRVYDASAATSWKWRNKAGNAVDGAGNFGSAAQRKVAVTALQQASTSDTLREETVQFRLISTPGYSELFDEMVTLNSDRNETAFIIVDAPFKKTPNEALEWIQGTKAAENGNDGLVGRNTYAAAYYPSVLTTNPSTGDSVVAPASHSILYTYAYSDNVSFQWFAPAGMTRGVVQNASNVGYIDSENEFVAVAVNQGQRDAMYENKLNPIARFVAEGIIVYGQKSLHPNASALDRVNVARLTAYLRERFAVIGRPYLFEANDDNTRVNAKATFDGFMNNILAQRGVYDFAVVCDTTNNTPARIDANELYIDVAIEPTKAAEFIYIPVRIVNTGELG